MKSVHCTLYGHDFVLTKHVTKHVKEYSCKNCKKEVTTSSNGHLTSLNEHRKETNKTLHRMYRVKNEKSLAV